MTVNMMLLGAIFCGLTALFIGANSRDERINKKLRLSRRQIELQREQARKEGYSLELDKYLNGTESYLHREKTQWGEYQKEINI